MTPLTQPIAWLLNALRLWRISKRQVPANDRAGTARQRTSITNAISPTGICGLRANPTTAEGAAAPCTVATTRAVRFTPGCHRQRTFCAAR